MMTSCKRETLNTIILKHETFDWLIDCVIDDDKWVMLKPKLYKTWILKLEAWESFIASFWSYWRGGSGGFLKDLPKIGFKIETMMMMTSCKRETLNTIILEHETFDWLIDCFILVMKLSVLNSLLVVRVGRGVRWLSWGPPQNRV